ncbi:MAG TPA: sigma 54-interacting transcriptional regulator [Opitutaceae bacterium]|nr:sigma 54-interacting transcriptional regulator [Opitutaceae bacterium]
MSLLTPTEGGFADAVSRLIYANPFLPERIEAERDALAADFVRDGAEWNLQPGAADAGGSVAAPQPNLALIRRRVDALVERLAGVWPTAGARPPAATDAERFGDLVLFAVFHRYCARFDETLASADPTAAFRAPYFRDFANEVERLLRRPGMKLLDECPPEALFAFFFQVRRAFVHIHRSLVGASRPMARLRAAIWQSIFTHDMRRYRRCLFARMDEITTLVTGESGTGKELVARALALSRHLPFDSRRGQFAGHPEQFFFPLNIAALSPTLVESELFGHRRGAFTGALADRSGWLEVCPATGTVFLDEIGEVDASIQVKLLRVLQSRTFQRLGESEPRRFAGRIVAATNRDLEAEIRAGRFREDFFFRLCGDQIAAPSLREQLADAPGDLALLVGVVARRLVGEIEAPAVAAEVLTWIERELGSDYAWPGNFRELEQCVRNILLRREYHPRATASRRGAAPDWETIFASGSWTAERLLAHYCCSVHAHTQNIEETARRLDLDRRTVKAKLGTAAFSAGRT